MNNKLMTNIRLLLPLYAVVFLGFFGYALTVALFIPMLMDPTSSLLPTDASDALRVTISGFLLATYPLGQFIGSPIIGKLSDHYGRKKVLMISLFLCLIGLLGITVSIYYHFLFLLFLSCLFTGLSESNMAIAQSVLAEQATNIAQRTKLIGYAYSACSAGYIAGPLVGGLGTVIYGYSFPFLLTAIGVLILFFWVAFEFKDNYKPQANVTIKWLSAITAIGTLISHKRLRKIYLVNFMIFFAIQGLYRVTPIYVMDQWHPSIHTFTNLIAFVSLLCFIANLIFLGPLAKKFDTEKLLMSFLLFSTIFIISIVVPTNFHWIWITYGLAVIPTVMALTTATTWLSNHALPHEQGQVLGNNQALLVLGEALSAGVGGMVAAIKVSLPVIMVAVILVVCSVLIWRFSNKPSDR